MPPLEDLPDAAVEEQPADASAEPSIPLRTGQVSGRTSPRSTCNPRRVRRPRSCPGTIRRVP